MRSALRDLQPVKQPSQLPMIQLQHLLPGLGPAKTMLLQSFLPQAETITVPLQNLDHIEPTVTKYKQMSRKRVQLHLILNQHGKPVYGFSHIGDARSKIHLRIGWSHYDDNCPSVSTSLASVETLKLSPISTL